MSLDSYRKQIVNQQAAYWYCRWFDERRMPYADRQEFVTWLKQSPENVSAILQIADLDGMLVERKLLDCIDGLRVSNIIEPNFDAWVGRHDYQPSESVSDEVPRAKKVAGKASWKSKLFTAWRAAAAVGGLALAGTFGYLQFSGTPEHVVETRAAQWQRMALEDGSTIHLDARTRIEVEFSAARRIIHLIHGSAVFDVVKDHHRPFVVKAGHVEVTAVGTRFGVDRDDGVRTTVEDGIVEVRARDGRDDQSVLLHKGQQLYVAPESRSMLSVAAIAEVDAKRELSWVTGRLEMADTTLGEIVRQFNRRQRIQAEIRDAELADRPVDLALMQVDNVEDFVEVMESRGVTVIRDGSTLILRASGTR